MKLEFRCNTDTPLHIVTVSALVTDLSDRVLMVLSPRRGWEFPGGQIEEGESLPQALEREILEETGIVAAVNELAGIYSSIAPPSKVHFGFLCSWLDGNPKTSDESLESAWVSRDEVPARITHHAIHPRIRDMLSFDGRIIYRTYSVDPYSVVEERFLSS